LASTVATLWISLTLETSSSRVNSGSSAFPAIPRCRQLVFRHNRRRLPMAAFQTCTVSSMRVSGSMILKLFSIWIFYFRNACSAANFGDTKSEDPARSAEHPCAAEQRVTIKYFSEHERWTYSLRTRNHRSLSLIGSRQTSQILYMMTHRTIHIHHAHW
jgi:hypothetical protein